MYKFSDRSLRALQDCHPDLKTIANEVIKHIDIIVLEGHRGEEMQNKMKAEGKSQLRFPQSKHNKMPSLAMDIAPYPVDWNNRERFFYMAGIVKGIAVTLKQKGLICHDIRWGGDWDKDGETTDNRFDDLPHIELI